MKSMTGFGRAVVERDGRTCTVEIRTVNHRYCEISFRLPRSLSALEPEAKRFLQERFPRGSISVSVILDGREEDPGMLIINSSVANRYVELLGELKKMHGLTGDVDINTVALLPDLFTFEQREVDKQEVWPLLEAVLGQAAERVDENRGQEGEHLAREFESRIGRMGELLDRLDGRGPVRAREMKERLKARLDTLTPESEIDPGRLAQELAVLADRIDYTEEYVRLRAHTHQFLEIMRSDGPLGRRLNFLVQEMGREANTIGSKANDPEISGVVINIKEEIEKLREQVQNIE
jgi:uncharacterized protein (TIGR00255 family)